VINRKKYPEDYVELDESKKEALLNELETYLPDDKIQTLRNELTADMKMKDVEEVLEDIV
jgi:hypothetical protein